MMTKKNLLSILLSTCLFLLAVNPLHAEITEGLLAHYALEEGVGTTATDSSINGLDGTLAGPAWTQGRIGEALFFDGQDDRVELGTMDISGSALTIMAWIKINAFFGQSSDGRIISKADGVAEAGHYWMLSTIDSNGTKLRFRLKTDGETSTIIGGSVSTNEWIHVAAVYDGSLMSLYRNGIQVAASAKTGAISEDSSVSTWLGDQPPSAGSRPWNGIIDEVRIYESALTSAEIQLVMNNGNEFPLVSLSLPTHNQHFSPDDTVQLMATASDADGTIQTVEFFAGDVKIGGAATSPYNATWQNVSEGTHQITARATDNEGSFTISSPPHQILVGGGGPTQEWVHKSTKIGDLDPPTSSGNQQTASLVLDINKDGITDFVVTDRSAAPSVVWYESSDAGSWFRHVVEPDRISIEAGGTFTDIDRDGDLDLVFGGDGSSNQMWWWENPSPDYAQGWIRRFVKNSGPNKHHDQMFGDFDGDGRDELASWNQSANQLILFEIPADPKNTQPWPYTSIAAASSNHEGMAVFDVDGDGVEDIIGAGRWYRHNSGATYDEFVVDSSQTYGRSAAGQFIDGGYAELIYGPGDSSGDLKFYKYNGVGGWDATLIKAGVDHGHSLHTADFNQDGNLDVFCAEMRLNGGNSDAKTWIFYGDGAGNFTESIVAEGIGNHESRPADLDGDGDIDILGKPYNWDSPRLDIWLNHGTGSQTLSLDLWERHLVGVMPENGVFIETGDINGDQYVDLIAGAWWWQNPGTLAGQWIRHTIGSPLNNMAFVYDFDLDGDLDILGTTGLGSSSSHTFRWARNNGAGIFSLYDNLQTGGSGDFLQGRLLEDFGSGKQVVLSWHNGGGGVQTLDIPALPSSDIWPFSTLSTTTLSEDLSAGDIDRDGDLDLLLGTIWLENNGGSWTSHTLGQITDLHAGAEPDRNDLADINGDGRLDAVVALENGTSVVWFSAPVDPTELWERHIVGTVAGQGFSMDTADFDGDSDPDIVVGEHRGDTNNRVIIFENQDDGATWVEHIIDSDSVDTIDHHDGTQSVDLDNDGDLDLISIGWYNKKAWIFENKAIDGGSPSSAPVITAQPADAATVQGKSVTFTVSASGAGQLTYQWQRNGINIPFATSPSFQTWALSLEDNGSYYSCIVSNAFGQAITRNGVVTVIPVTGDDTWWNNDWRYRFPVTINAADHLRTEFPVEFLVNFTEIMAELGATGEFDPKAIRVIEVTSTGAIVNGAVAFQFDQASDYNALSNASGSLTFIAHGTTGSSETRYYQIYFDTVNAGHPAAVVNQYITVTDGVAHKGFDSFQIDTKNGSWFFHKSGAGFATLLDSEGQDWIGFANNSGSAASGWYRGIPNAVYPEDMMHPGRSGCQSVIESQGVIKIVIKSTCSDWKSTWTIYPSFAKMSMDTNAHDYWFQYEGTPGGSTEASDFIVTSDAAVTSADDDWTLDIPGEEWAYLGDNGQDRVIFIGHQEDDSHPERFYRMDGATDGGMVIFSFGRGSGTSSYLTAVPQHFIVGLLETKDYSQASTAIRGLFFDISIAVGVAEGIPQPNLDISDIYYGDVEVGENKDETITLYNTGTADLIIGQIAFANSLAAPFWITADTCSNQTLPPGGSCIITIRFSPLDDGNYSDSFDIPTNADPPTVTVSVHSGFKKFPWPMFIPALSRK